MTDHTDVLLFDVGGILIRMSGIDAWKALTGDTDDAEIWRKWLTCPVVQAFERGHSDIDTFAAHMIDAHNLPIDAPEFVEAFSSWPGGLLEGAHELVTDVVHEVRVGCFSNTNEVHWNHPCNQTVHQMFDLHFLSFEMGHVKPDVSAFEFVTNQLGCDPERIFFVDDNILNIDAARACGFNAHLVKGPAQTRSVLSSHGLIKDVG